MLFCCLIFANSLIPRALRLELLLFTRTCPFGPSDGCTGAQEERDRLTARSGRINKYFIFKNCHVRRALAIEFSLSLVSLVLSRLKALVSS